MLKSVSDEESHSILNPSLSLRMTFYMFIN